MKVLFVQLQNLRRHELFWATVTVKITRQLRLTFTEGAGLLSILVPLEIALPRESMFALLATEGCLTKDTFVFVLLNVILQCAGIGKTLLASFTLENI
jgi:hypothetical protein